MHHSLVTVAVAFVLGVSLDGLISCPVATTWWALAAASAVATAAHLLRRPEGATRVLLLACAIAGLLRSQMSDPLLDPHHFVNATSDPALPIRLQIDDDPEIEADRAVCAAQLRTDASGKAVTGLIRLTIRRIGGYRPAYGDTLACRALPEPLLEVPPAEASSRLRSLKQQGVLGQLAVGPDQIEVVDRGDGNPLLTLAFGLRHKFSELLIATHEAQTAAFVRGMVLGEKGDIARGTLDDFRTTGTVHILCQAGLHVGILALVLTFFLRLLPLGVKLPAMLTIGALVVYAAMTGGRTGVLRAVVMASCVIISQVTDRKASPFNGVALAALILLIVRPSDIYTPGFQLSFAATISIFFLTPWLMSQIESFATYGASTLAASIAVYLGTLPLMAYHFGSVSLVAPIANIFVMPLVAIIMPTALLALATALVSAQLAYVFAAANFGFVVVLTWGLGWLARVPYAQVTVPAPWPSLTLLYYLGLLIAADQHNIARLIGRRQPAVEKTPANADWSWILANRPMDPLMARLERFLDGAQSLVPSDEVTAGLETQLGADLAAQLDPITRRYLALAHQQVQETGGIPESAGTVATIAYLMATERELDARVFRFLKVPDEVARSEVARTFRRGHINRPPRPQRDVMAMPLQSELLWHYLLPTGGTHKTLVQSLSRELGERLSKPALYLEPSRLALALDRMLKKYYLPIVAGDTFDRARAQQAARDILGDPNFALLREIVSAGTLAPPTSEEPHPAAGETPAVEGGGA